MGKKVRQRKVQDRNGNISSNEDTNKPDHVGGGSSGSFVLIGMLIMAGTVVVFLFYPNTLNFMNMKQERAIENDVVNTEETKQTNIHTNGNNMNTEKPKNPNSKDKRSAEQLPLKSTAVKAEPERAVKPEPELPKEMRDFKPTFLKTMSPKKIFADGRRLPPVELLPQKPNNSSVRVYLYNEFLSEAECDGLMKVHDKHVEESSKKDPLICFDSIATLRKHLKAAKKNVKVTPKDFQQGTTCLNASFSTQMKIWLKSNWSYSTAFYPGESRFSKIFEHRVKEATALSPENGGKFQITSYPLDIGYKTHTDCVEDNEDQRDRMATILVYLQDVDEGGETEFPELGIWVKPRKGRALVWNNMNEEGKCEHMSLHKAAKVTSGHKYILQRWYYHKSFYSLGKRPPPPHLPIRDEDQPMVSCDEYEHGSCRWYDEWNYDNILEYKSQRFNLV